MNVDLVIAGVDDDNKYHKLQQAAKALSDNLGLDAVIELPYIEKAKTHKYITKKWVNDHWEYEYPQTNNERRVNTTSQITDIMTNIQPLAVTPSNVRRLINTFKQDFMRSVNSGLYVKYLQNRKVVGIIDNHLTAKHGNGRQFVDIENHVKYLPFVIPLIQKYGHVSQARLIDGRRYYELTGKAEIKGKKYAISIILMDNDNKIDLVCVSSFGFTNKMVKAIGGAWPVALTLTKPTHAGRRLGRRGTIPPPYSDSPNLDDHVPTVQSTQQRTELIEQLYPIADGTVFSIPQISAKSIQNYPDLELFIQDITPENRKGKFTKAIRAASRQFHIPMTIDHAQTGESYLYPVQQELSDQWTGYYQGILRKIYGVVIEALGLPPVEVETMRKALGDSGILKYRGKIIYNPETGEPLKNKDFDDLIEAIQNFLNRNTKDIAKQILLDSTAIGKLLRRMAKYQSSADMTRLKLENLKYRGKTFDWIRKDIRNLTNTLGVPLSGPEMARYQVAQNYVAQLVTRSNNKIKDEIKDTVLRGILEKRTKGQVSQDLFNRLGGLNRDWKRIADTEIVNTSNLAGILQEVNDAPKGERIYFKRYELPGCCDKCAKVNGVIALWSNTQLADDKIKDPYAKIAIWEGKPQEKGKTVLVTGTLHPNCRGGWLRWGGKQADAMTAQIRGKAERWDAAVKQAREEYQKQGTENPNDQTPGYIDRINELYREKLGEA